MNHSFTRYLTTLACLLMISGFSCTSNAREYFSQVISPNILFILYDNAQLPYNTMIIQSFESKIKQHYPGVNLFVEYFDAERFKDQRYIDLKYEYIKQKYTDVMFDFVLIDSNEHPAFEQQAFSLFPKVPKLVLHQSYQSRFRETPTKKALSVKADFASAAEHALQLTKAQHIFVMHHENPENNMHSLEELRASFEAHKLSLNEHYLGVASHTDAMEKINTLPKDSLILLTPFYISLDEVHISPKKFAQGLAQQSKVPIFVHFDSMISERVMGGYVVSIERIADEMATAAKHLIAGQNYQTSASNIYEYVYSYSALALFDIPESALPEQYRLTHQPKRFFDEFTLSSLITAAVSLLLLISVALILKWNMVLAEQKKRLHLSRDELLSSNARADMATSSSSLGIWEYDLASEQMYWNTWMYRHHGVTSHAESLNLKAWLSRVHPKDSLLIERKLLNAIGRKQSVEAEYRVEAEGKCKYFHLKAQLVSDDDNLPARLLGTLSDVTEQVEYNNKLESEKIEAETATRAKSEFLAGMSHEIRTPMNGVIGAAELLVASDLAPEQAKYAHIIKSSATGLLRILNDILDLSKIENNKLKISKHQFDLSKALKELVLRHMPQAKNKGLKLQLNIQPQAKVWINADSMRLQQVLHHLIDNAIKFTDIGDIDINVALVSKKDYRGQLLTKLVIAVKDTGIGIHRDKHEQIFSRFVQSDNVQVSQTEGAGLGLTISNHLLKLMQGKLRLESQLHYGSCFTIELPVEVVQAEQQTAMSKAASHELNLKGKRILIVDDNAINHQLLAQMLLPSRASVSVAESGAEAIQAVERASFDLIFMDIIMPEMDGLEATRRIRDLQTKQARTQCTIVSISADNENQSEDEYLKAGFDDVLAKPINQDALHQLLMRLIVVPEQAHS